MSWSAPTEDGGSALISYTLGIIDETSATAETYVTLSSSAYDYTFTGLTPGYQYSIRIKATNLIGDSDYTDTITVYAGIEPTRPGLFTFTSTTRNSITLDWSALTGSDTGGTATQPITITSYDLYIDNGYNGDFSLLVSQTGTTYTATYLTSGLLYRFKMQATNSIGMTSEFSTIQYMMAGTTPSSPGQPT